MTEILILILIMAIIWGLYLLADTSKKTIAKEMVSMVYIFGLLILFEYYDGILWSYLVFLLLCALILVFRFLTRRRKVIHWVVSSFALWGLILGSYESLVKFSGLSRFLCLLLVLLGVLLSFGLLVYIIFKQEK